MKNLIKQLLRESLLTERLTDIDDDVDMLYNRFFKNTIDTIHETGQLNRDMFRMAIANTSMLRSHESKLANDVNKCKILMNGQHTNTYSPNSKIISLGFNNSILNFIIDKHNGDLSSAMKDLDEKNQARVKQEFTEHRVKGSIHHELAHWVDDSMNNRHIAQKVNTSGEFDKGLLNGKPINASKMELQAQIHNVKQLHNKFSDTWDSMTFQDMINLSPSLSGISDQLEGPVKTQWIRDLKTRMHREGLLGKNMVNN